MVFATGGRRQAAQHLFVMGLRCCLRKGSCTSGAIRRLCSSTTTLAAETEEVELPKTDHKNSRFIGRAAPCSSQQDARQILSAWRDQHSSASHICWAQILPNNSGEYCSDDGEPGGSAGPPILAAIGRMNMSAVLVGVTRFYGGTNLGTGGLARAYGAAAAAALNRAVDQGLVVDGWRARGSGILLSLATSHNNAGKVQALVSKMEAAGTIVDGAPGRSAAVALEDVDYNYAFGKSEIGVRLMVRAADSSAVDVVVDAVRDACRGQVEVLTVAEE